MFFFITSRARSFEHSFDSSMLTSPFFRAFFSQFMQEHVDGFVESVTELRASSPSTATVAPLMRATFSSIWRRIGTFRSPVTVMTLSQPAALHHRRFTTPACKLLPARSSKIINTFINEITAKLESGNPKNAAVGDICKEHVIAFPWYPVHRSALASRIFEFFGSIFILR